MRKQIPQNGFTLVEIIVTIAVFAVILPAVVGMTISLTTINDRARELATTNAIAQNKIEELRSKGFIAVDLGTETFTSELPSTLNDATAEYVVSEHDPDGAGGAESDPSLKEVLITIEYDDHGETRTLNYKTYLGELGVGQY